MAFNRENLTIMANNAKAGVVPTLWLYWNEASDTVTAAGFFTDKRLAVGDQIDVLVAAFTSFIRYRVSAVSATGAATVTSAASTTYSAGGVQTLTGAGAVNLTTDITLLVITGSDAITLADGTVGQRKIIKVKTDGGTATLTPTNLADGTTLTFADVNDSVELIFADDNWQVISNNGVTVA